ncbi:MAG: 16S rRNA (cytidine(1402)-2'-O)-methyltransferase [Nostoc sp. ZfuVER08]|jgi:16S rRNA (cytidine1402-2'-O)-methyltransferase|uniref:Ribosomal RNA small subunit methyltransferase I n=1 Tax=Nostoc punctiforme FACHB-252 TaxID=1357509 RepID=A0ABR8HBJ2_NOSPU|nr:16S rRNA (cytidine(1402)-2'-O)-methyltransferase [Nostoc punctiforme]MBD2613113.1 16S rRNA (cytidine(1402)-2'-O)-methyltransferase [Nostoc punctiforme FACHB-252]MBL1201079.1 16S rRNA (cytidine(1402)-2'-O)-methyltransferase [Nostoc sp. GBBB01]MDZ8011619.1 16S rRNA (cytidine(1402)-2'-O)-methyltransferase [Nostoc sp. ZfuVER08]
MQTDPKPRTLYVVGTPIGNLEDMTFRAVRILQTVDMIAAEDTRHTGKLLQHFEIKTPQISYHEHNRTSRIPELLQYLTNDKAIALVSDAGMPGISDPGYELIEACIEAGISVVPIPGASAAITALSAAGLPTDRFVFEGFLPAKSQQRREHLESLQTESRTLIFYESPHRLQDTLQDLAEILGSDRQIVLARELTKLYEEFWRGTIAEAIAHYSQREPQGEYTLVVAGIPPSQPQLTQEELKAELKQLISQGISRSQASRQLAKETSLPRRQLYQLALSLVITPDS